KPRKGRELRRRRADVFGGAVRLWVPSEQLARARLDAVDAEQVVQQRTGERQREAHGDPAERGLRPAFVEQRVNGSKRRRGESEGCGERREKLACLHAPMCSIRVGVVHSRELPWNSRTTTRSWVSAAMRR